MLRRGDADLEIVGGVEGGVLDDSGGRQDLGRETEADGVMQFNRDAGLRREQGRGVMAEMGDKIEMVGGMGVAGSREGLDGGGELGFGNEEIEVEEEAFGGVGKDVGE